MTRFKGCFYYLAVIAVIALLFGALMFYGGKFIDRYQQPWAYSKTDPLLVGRWQGTFKDPDGIAKKLTIAILEPTTDDERLGNVFSRHSRSFSSKRAFDGTATITSRSGSEFYELWGSVNQDDYHDFSLNFQTSDNTKLRIANFYVTNTKQNHWEKDNMTLELSFSFRRPDGSSFWDSKQPKFSQKALVDLHRIIP